MRRLLSALLIFTLLICTLASCDNNELEISVHADGYVVVNGVTTNIVADKDDVISVDADGYVVVNSVKTEYKVASDDFNKIHYSSLGRGIKIESLPLVQQQIIDEYVSDCQTLYTAAYAQFDTWDLDLFGEPYISFTDTFVYDFSCVNESDVDTKTANMWNDIKALNDNESAPIMYIELSGYSNFLGDAYKVTSLMEASIIYGYFIFENETVVPLLYKDICARQYYYKLPNGTELINCGDKYSGEKKMKELVDLYLYMSTPDGLPTNDLLKRLTLIK